MLFCVESHSNGNWWRYLLMSICCRFWVKIHRNVYKHCLHVFVQSRNAVYVFPWCSSVALYFRCYWFLKNFRHIFIVVIVMCSLFSTRWAKTLKNFVYLSCINVLSCLLRLTEFSVPYVYLLRTLVKSSCLFIFVVIFLTVSADFSTSSVCMHSVPSAVLLSSSLLCKHVQVDFYGHHVIDMCWSSIVILDLFVLLMD